MVGAWLLYCVCGGSQTSCLFSCINYGLTDVLSPCINITEQMRKMPQNGSCTHLLIAHSYYLSIKKY